MRSVLLTFSLWFLASLGFAGSNNITRNDVIIFDVDFTSLSEPTRSSMANCVPVLRIHSGKIDRAPYHDDHSGFDVPNPKQLDEFREKFLRPGSQYSLIYCGRIIGKITLNDDAATCTYELTKNRGEYWHALATNDPLMATDGVTQSKEELEKIIFDLFNHFENNANDPEGLSPVEQVVNFFDINNDRQLEVITTVHEPESWGVRVYELTNGIWENKYSF